MRGLKIVGFVVGGLLALLVLLLVLVSVFVNPNDFKGRIAAEVKAATGRDLTLQGDIKLSVFPWVALNLGPLSLGNPAGFGSDPFLTVQHTALRVKLLPLLRQRLEVGRIQVDGLDLRLKTNAEGKGNWQDPGQQQQPAAAANPGGGSGAGSLKSLDGIRITSSRISYNALTLAGLNVDVGSVSQRVAVPVSAEFDLNTGPGGTDMHLRAALKATLDSVAQRYGLQAVKFDGDLRLKDSGSKLPWKFTAPALEVDLAAQTLKAADFSMNVGAAQLNGSLTGEKILAAPQFVGSFRLGPLMLRDFLKQLDVALPRTQDSAALSKIAASSDFSYGLNALQLQKLSVQLDDTRLSGAAAITNLDTKALSFDLKVDHIDLDRYMAPKIAAAPGARTRAITAAPAPTPLPTTAARVLNLNGTFVIESAKVEGMTVSAVSLKMQARDGVVHLSPLKASLYGGTYAGDITYDAHGAVPAVNVDQQVTGVDMAALLKDGMKSERLSGHGNAMTKLAGAGLTSEALLCNLSGRVEMNLADGAVMGIDLWYELNRAQALLKQQSLPAGSDDKRTKFDSFKASADVSGGVATTKDLNVASQNLRVTGGGTTNLVTEAIDYHIVASVLKAPPAAKNVAQSQLTLGDIPVEITGTASDPKVRPDLQGLMKSQLKQKLQDTLKDKLQGILGH